MTSAAITPELEFHNHLYASALLYLSRGWSFFPVSLTSKKPVNDWKHYQTQRTTREDVEDWFRNGAPTKDGDRLKFFNLSIVTGAISGIVILDCDNEAAIEFAHQNRLVSPFAVRTTRGMHYYFAHPMNGSRYANKVGGVGRDWPDIPGLDFRGDGGYAIMPPSVSFNEDGTPKHQYQWEDCAFDWDQAPKWTFSNPAMLDVTTMSAETFSFDSLNLSDTKVGTAEVHFSVWEQAEAHIHKHGKLGQGGGRNQWLIKYAGEQVRKGVTGKDLFITCEAFQTKFFATFLDPIEFQRTVTSAIDMDKRNYPDDYTAEGERKDKEEEARKKLASVVVTFNDLKEIKDSLKEERFFLDPVIAPGTITQIVGYNGHGKSLMAYGMAWAMAMGVPFGPFDCDGPHKTMYFDFEMGRGTFVERLELFQTVYGNPNQNFNWWCQSLAYKRGGEDINLMTQEGRAAMTTLLHEVQPEIVVIDTVRSAFDGLDEKSPEAWANVNRLAKAIRNAGCAVILIHHRNKPGESGLGREAGSTAQLTDIDTQLFVTSVFRKEDEAKRKAGIHDSTLSVEDSSGKSWTPYGYLENRIDTSEWRIRSVMQLDFGKVRQVTDNHTENYVGFAENITTGAEKIISTYSMRQKVKALAASGKSAVEISMKLYLPLTTVKRWLA
jgi:hypothetical protein